MDHFDCKLFFFLFPDSFYVEFSFLSVKSCCIPFPYTRMVTQSHAYVWKTVPRKKVKEKMQELASLALSTVSAPLLIPSTLGKVNASAVKLVMRVVTHPSQSSGDWNVCWFVPRSVTHLHEPSCEFNKRQTVRSTIPEKYSVQFG